MPLLDVQRRGAELGRIRIGAQLVRDGKSRPVKLETFRLTTPSEAVARDAAAAYGGDVVAWTPERGRAGTEWEVRTGLAELPCLVPPGEPLSQWWELWSGAGCERRCDGRLEQLTRTRCLCPPAGADRAELAAAGKACKPTSRLTLRLPDVRGIGVWVLVSHGWHAATELAEVAELLHDAALAGRMLPAVLRLQQREVKRPGQVARSFAVPVLDLDVSLRQLAGGRVDPLPPPPPAVAAQLEAHRRELTAADPLDGELVDTLDPQALADAAADALTRADVEALAERAGAAHRLDALVADPDGVAAELSAVLSARWKELPP